MNYPKTNISRTTIELFLWQPHETSIDPAHVSGYMEYFRSTKAGWSRTIGKRSSRARCTTWTTTISWRCRAIVTITLSSSRWRHALSVCSVIRLAHGRFRVTTAAPRKAASIGDRGRLHVSSIEWVRKHVNSAKTAVYVREKLMAVFSARHPSLPNQLVLSAECYLFCIGTDEAYMKRSVWAANLCCWHSSPLDGTPYTATWLVRCASLTYVGHINDKY